MAKRLQIYGQPSTRTNRPLWMAHELGLDFENVPVVLLAPDEDDLNPNRKQPYLVDTDGTTVFESLAINLYLVRQNPAHELSPRSSAEEAKLLQWTMWAMTELDPILFEGIFIAMPDGAHPLANNESFLKRFGRERSAERLTRLTNELEWPLGVLDAALAGGDWLGGDRFTATDLNVSVVLGWTTLFPGALKPFPNIQAWMARCYARPLCPYHSEKPAYMMVDHGLTEGHPRFAFNSAGMDERYAKL